jgi:hypothetical protein
MNFLLFLIPVVLVFGQYLRSTPPKECPDCDA